MASMSVSRRGFLGTLLASIAGTAFAEAPGKLLWAPAESVALPPVAAEALLTLDAITMEMARLLATHVNLPIVSAKEGLRIGEHGMTKQIGIDMMTPGSVIAAGLDSKRYIEPAAYAMAQKVKHEGWQTFGELLLPSSVDHAYRVTSTRDGVSVRGILDYRPWNGNVLRFDVIGAA